MPRFRSTPSTLALAFVVLSGLLVPGLGAQSAPADSASVARVVEDFHSALERGDSAAAIKQLAPGAVILESGSAETVAEYRSHHLSADIEFARAIKSARSALRVTVRGDMAWAAGTSTTEGDFKGRAVNSAGTELLVLERGTSGWRITAIHWSSHRRT